MTDAVEERVRAVMADVFGLDPAGVGRDTSADTVEAWDSLQHLSLVLAVEEEFDLQFGDTETTEMVSFPLVVAIVHEKLGAPEAAD
jgi:acyl carrier protein